MLAAAVNAQADDSLPTRVGRVANVQGTLYHAPDDAAGEWSEIGLNYPVAQGDSLWADRGALAEIDYGGGQFRLAGDANVHVSRLDERQLALFIASGSVIVRVRVLAPDDSVRVDTPSTQVEFNRPGLYRIDVDQDAGQSSVIVREGEADVATPRGMQQVLPGQAAALDGTAEIANAGRIDGFDTWSAARDRVYEAARRNTYVSREMVGQYDLDTYGRWQTYPDYGAVWFPTVEPEWAPYRFGHWTWLRGWGYTWVDNAPWGYAPFHYGRWAYIGGRWGWCPGAFVARPAWAPALVAWYGGAGWDYSASYGAPVYGWVPLGWGDPFVPWWRGCTLRCEVRYNRPYGVDAAARRRDGPAHFANWTVPGAVTAVPAATLATGRPVAINRVPIATSRPIAPPLLTQPPAVPPAPVRPGAVSPGNGVPLPAVNAARAAVPPASPNGFARTPPAAPAPRTPLRIDDGRGVLPPASPVQRSARPAAPLLPSPLPAPPFGTSPAPAPAIRPAPAAPLSPVVPERSFRPAPVPPPAARPAPIRVPAPQMPLPQVPVPQAPAPAMPRMAPPPPVPVAPAPLRAVPAPAPAPAAVPPPAGPERAPARVAPAPPKPPGGAS